MQAGSLGEPSLQFTVPEGLLLDDEGGSITDAALAPTDIVTALVAIAAATIDLTANHTNFTLNNMIACLVATDILQVSVLTCCSWLLHVCTYRFQVVWAMLSALLASPCYSACLIYHCSFSCSCALYQC